MMHNVNDIRVYERSVPNSLKMMMTSPQQKQIENYVYNDGNYVGEGQFSKVYHGRNIYTQEPVAIKIIDTLSIKDQVFLTLLNNEIQILNMLEPNQNILKVYGIFENQSNVYIVTELCNQGREVKFNIYISLGDLATRITKQRAIDEETAIFILQGLLNGLVNLKRQMTIHRDIKPANIMFANGVAKIGDFGFAVSKKLKNPQYNLEMYNVGTPLYMSPETILKNQYSFKSDIWAVGIVYYEMLYGNSVFISYNYQVCLHSTLALNKNSFIKSPPIAKTGFCRSQAISKFLNSQSKQYKECYTRTNNKDGPLNNAFNSQNPESPLNKICIFSQLQLLFKTDNPSTNTLKQFKILIVLLQMYRGKWSRQDSPLLIRLGGIYNKGHEIRKVQGQCCFKLQKNSQDFKNKENSVLHCSTQDTYPIPLKIHAPFNVSPQRKISFFSPPESKQKNYPSFHRDTSVTKPQMNMTERPKTLYQISTQYTQADVPTVVHQQAFPTQQKFKQFIQSANPQEPDKEAYAQQPIYHTDYYLSIFIMRVQQNLKAVFNQNLLALKLQFCLLVQCNQSVNCIPYLTIQSQQTMIP